MIAIGSELCKIIPVVQEHLAIPGDLFDQDHPKVEKIYIIINYNIIMIVLITKSSTVIGHLHIYFIHNG